MISYADGEGVQRYPFVLRLSALEEDIHLERELLGWHILS